MGQIKMTKEDREYFKRGVKTLCGTELLFVGKLILGEKEVRKIIDPEDFEFIRVELGRQAGALWGKLLRSLKKEDYAAAVELLRVSRKPQEDDGGVLWDN